MRLYLSSYRLGNHYNRLLSLVGAGRRVAIIENALDNLTEAKRHEHKTQKYNIHEIFINLGFMPQSFDLRDYFQGTKNIYADLKAFDLVWVCGGNAFLLRRAMQQSGFDTALPKLLAEDAIAYGGWSAGICVLAPTMNGYELCDDPNEIADGYNADIIWSGLGIIEWALAPHYKSDHPEAQMIERVVEYLEAQNIPYRTMRDGDVLVYEDSASHFLKLEDGVKDSLNADRITADRA